MLLLLASTALATPWSTDLADLDPGFRARVDRVLTALNARGFHPAVSCTWRDPAVQDLLLQVGGATQAAGGESCHNRVDDQGRPAAQAIDLWSLPLDLPLLLGLGRRLAAELPFLHVLGQVAHLEGLRWGGDWHGRPSAWSPHGLGWDPAHLEDGQCRGVSSR